MTDRKIPYGAEERDLTRLVGDRVRVAIDGVLQLTTTPGQALLLATSSLSTLTAYAGAAYARHYGHAAGEVDPFDVSIALLGVMQGQRDEVAGAAAGARLVLQDAALYRAQKEAGGPVSAVDLVAKLAQVSGAIAFQAGEPELETAGMILSTLVKRPELIARFMTEGSSLLVDGEIGPLTGVLSYRAVNGEIRRPEDAIAAREARDHAALSKAEGRSLSSASGQEGGE